MTNSKSVTARLIEQLKTADPKTQLTACVKLALAGDWKTIKGIGGSDLVAKTAKKIESLEKKVAEKCK